MVAETSLKISLLVFGFGLIVACQSPKQATPEEGVQRNVVARLNEVLSPEEQLEADRNREGALGDMVMGNPDAPVTLIEIGSLTCSHCATFHIDHFPAIKEKFIDTNKVKFIFRSLPTPPQNKSFYASMYARCIAGQNGEDAFFTMTNALFNEQSLWAYSTNTLQDINDIAGNLGYNTDTIASCTQRQEIIAFITRNAKDAQDNYDVTGTPSFILDGKKLNIRSYTDLTGAIENALNEDGVKETARKYK